MQVKKHQLEQDMEQQTGSKLAKEYVKAVYCHPVYLTYMQSTSCEMPGWMRHKLESRLPGEMSITSDMQMTPPLRQKVKRSQRASWWEWRGAEEPLQERRVEEESENAGLKLTIQKRSWHLAPSLYGKQMGKQWKQWQTIFLGSKITEDGDCSHEIKRRLLLGRKAVTNLDSLLESRH